MLGITGVVVVVPAHDEELLLGACLSSVATSLARLRATLPHVVASLVVVLDSCTDGSAAVVSSLAEARVVVTDASRVGAARAAGVRAAIDAAPTATRSLWIVNTDADTVVPITWLLRQVELADRGADAVLGTVVPSSGPDGVRLDDWWATHQLGEGHPHLHGANLGVRASAYLAAGGFADVGCHEDVALVAALRRTGAVCVATDTTRVTTSARTVGRVDGGFAGFLAALAQPTT